MSEAVLRAEPAGARPAPRRRRIGTLAVEQALISASSYAVSWTFVHTAPAAALPGFYLCWLWGWGLFAVLSELVLTPVRVLRADGLLGDGPLAALARCAGLAAAAAVAAAAPAALLGAGPVASGLAVAALTLAALAFFTRRVQADEAPHGLVPRAACYLLLAGAGAWTLAAGRALTGLTAVCWASAALIATALWGLPVRCRGAARDTAAVLRRTWPQGRWYGAATVTRVVLYSNGLVSLIQVGRGGRQTAVVAAMFVLIGPLGLVGAVLPWAHLPELRAVVGDREAFARVWWRQLGVYAGILAAMTVGLALVWRLWVHASLSDASLAAAVSAQWPVVLTLLASLVLTSWTGTALQALEKVKSLFVVLSVSGALAMCSVPLGVPAPVCVTLPYLSALLLGVGVVLRAVRPCGGRTP